MIGYLLKYCNLNLVIAILRFTGLVTTMLNLETDSVIDVIEIFFKITICWVGNVMKSIILFIVEAKILIKSLKLMGWSVITTRLFIHLWRGCPLDLVSLF